MPCSNPSRVWYHRETNPSGKRPTTYSIKHALDPSEPFEQRCGRCTYCRLRYASEWGVRCEKEASLWPSNHFITLTYDNEHLPQHNGLVLEDVPLFVKRLRRAFDETNLRTFGCAEYGTKTLRPHYHLLLFNSPLYDLKLYSQNNNNPLYTSNTLSKLWPKGLSTIGEVTFQSASYVARYNSKYTSSHHRLSHLTSSGEVIELPPPQSICPSKRPAIGRAWVEKYADQLFRDDFIYSRGYKMPIPRYFNKVLEELDPQKYAELKDMRSLRAAKHARERETIDYRAFREYRKIHDSLDFNPNESYVPRIEVETICLEAKAKMLERKI